MNWAVADQVIPSVSLALAVRVARAPAGRPVTVTATGWSTSAACGDTDIDALTRSRVHPVSPAAATNSTIKTGICRTRHLVVVSGACRVDRDSCPPSVVGLLSRVSGGAVGQAVLACTTSQNDGDQHRDREHPEPQEAIHESGHDTSL